MERWETFSHGADIGVRGCGPTRERAFELAATAMTAVITDPAGVAVERQVEIFCEAPDDDLLLLDFLNALVYEMAIRQMLFSRFEVEIRDGRLKALALGESVDRDRHRPAVEVKGATCTELDVHCDAAGTWHAQCVVDV